MIVALLTPFPSIIISQVTEPEEAHKILLRLMYQDLESIDMVDDYACKGLKGLSGAECSHSGDTELLWVFPAPLMVDHLMEGIEPTLVTLRHSPKIDSSHALWGRIDPKHTRYQLADIFRSEVDVEEVVLACILKAALAFVHMLPHPQEPSRALRERYPIFCRPPGVAPLPNSILITKTEAGKLSPRSTLNVEIKTPNSCSEMNIDALMDALGYAGLPFICPTHQAAQYMYNGPYDNFHITSKMILEIWTQLVKLGSTSWTMVSTYKKTFFAYRHKQALYLSRPYGTGDAVMAAAFSVIMCALGREHFQNTPVPRDIPITSGVPHLALGWRPAEAFVDIDGDDSEASGGGSSACTDP